VGIFAFSITCLIQNILPYYSCIPNAYFARLNPMGKMNNMQSVQNEVLYAMQPELAQQMQPHLHGLEQKMF
jgi:hypothetical protein